MSLLISKTFKLTSSNASNNTNMADSNSKLAIWPKLKGKTHRFRSFDVSFLHVVVKCIQEFLFPSINCKNKRCKLRNEIAALESKKVSVTLVTGLGYQALARLQSSNMADASNSEKDFSDIDLSDGSTDSTVDNDFSTAKRSSEVHRVKKSHNTNVKQKWKRRFRFLSYKHFLLHTRSVINKSNDKDLSTTPPEKNQREDEGSEGIYADDKGYLQGEIYEELESDEDIGFAGDVCKKLNLMPCDSMADHERTLRDDNDSLSTSLQTNTHNPEVIIVPSSRFVREILKGK